MLNMSPLFPIWLWQIVTPVSDLCPDKINFCGARQLDLHQIRSASMFDSPCEFRKHVGRVEQYHYYLRSRLSNTDTTLRARLSKSRLIPPTTSTNLCIYPFYAGTSSLPRRDLVCGSKHVSILSVWVNRPVILQFYITFIYTTQRNQKQKQKIQNEQVKDVLM